MIVLLVEVTSLCRPRVTPPLLSICDAFFVPAPPRLQPIIVANKRRENAHGGDGGTDK